MQTTSSIQTIEPIIQVPAEQYLTKEESRILTVARQPSNKAIPAVRDQLAAYSYAVDLEDICAATEKNYARREVPHYEKMYGLYRQQAKQLKLLALQTISNLIA